MTKLKDRAAAMRTVATGRGPVAKVRARAPHLPKRLRSQTPVKPKRSLRGRAVLVVAAPFAGMLIEYFLDPQQGRRRRAIVRDRTKGAVRTTFRRVGRFRRFTSSSAHGLGQRVLHLRQVPKDLNEPTLANKIRSEVLGDPHIKAGRINVNVEDGCAVLRGTLDSPEQIRAVEERVRRVPGVRGVRNMLHLPGAPAHTRAVR